MYKKYDLSSFYHKPSVTMELLKLFPLLLLFLIQNGSARTPSISNYGGFQKLLINEPHLFHSPWEQGSLIYPDTIVEGVENEDCKGHVTEWLLRLNNSGNGMDPWALHMVDAWGKFPAGILSGHVNSWGDFDECVDINVRDLQILGDNTAIPKQFKGLYCNIDLRIGNGSLIGDAKKRSLNSVLSKGGCGDSAPSLATCFPNSCREEDARRMLTNIFTLRGIPLSPKEYGTCYDADKPPLNAGSIFVLTMVSLILLTCLVATILDMYGIPKPHSLGLQSLLCFSLHTNVRKWANTNVPPGGRDMGCLNGIRFLSTCLVLMRNGWYAGMEVPFFNKMPDEHWTMMTVTNGSFGVDAFFVLSGLLMSLSVLKQLKKTSGKINIPMLYVHRYLRLTPALAVALAVVATLFPYLGRGPYWYMTEKDSENCRKFWWRNLLYIHTWFGGGEGEMCMVSTWYLSNDMWFYFLAPPLLLLMHHRETLGLILLTTLTLASCLSSFLMVYIFKTAPTIGMWAGEVATQFTNVYYIPYTRAQTFLVGVGLGYIFYKTQGRKVRIPSPLVYLLWVMSTAIYCSALYGIAPWYDENYELPRFASAFYAGFSRLGCGISIAWVIFASVKGYGWIINDFLSWTAFIPLSRLGYCVYLVAYPLQMVFHNSRKQPLVYSVYGMMNIYFGHLIMMHLVGFVLSLTVEAPCMRLEKLLLGNAGNGAPVKGNIANSAPVNGNGVKEAA